MPPAAITMPSRKNKPKRNDVPAKIDADVMRDARLVAAYEGVEIAELVSSILGPVLKQRLLGHQQAAIEAASPAKPRKPKPD